MKNLLTLIESLHKIESRPVKITNSVLAIDTDPSAPNGYVWPALRDWGEGSGAGVVLIEAAGAVGKSAAAAAMASRLNWPLVDAAKAQVGSYSLSGLIHDAFGFESPFLSEVASGSAGIVIDALDEAHLRAGTVNFQAFLENVRRLAGVGRGRPSIILFSRPDTAELIKLFFLEEDTPLSITSIEYFDYIQACSFISSYMKNQSKLYPSRHYSVAEKHAEPFEDMRDSMLGDIANALLSDHGHAPLDEWDKVKTFLGYSPVLSVLGEYLAVPNPAKFQKTILSDISNPEEILLKIIDNLLVREQKKFQDQIVPRLRAEMSALEEWDDFDNIYTPQEQGMRLVARSQGLSFSVQVPAQLPSELRAKYERDARQFMGDHPFLAGRDAVNIVFADYIQAKAAVDPQCSLSLTPSPRKSVGTVGPFFHQFVYQFADRHDDDTPHIGEELVSVMLSSWDQSSSSSGQISLYYQRDNTAELYLPWASETDRASQRRQFEVDELSGLLEISGRLAASVIYTDAAVRLEGEYGRFILGPYTQLRCDELIIDIDSISVDPGRIPNVVSATVKARSIAVNRHLSVDSPQPGAFEIVGKHPHPSLVPFLVTKPSGAIYVENGDYLTLCSILRRFEKGIGPSPSVYYDLMERRIINNNSARRRYLNRMIDLGLITRSSSHYYLDTAKLSKYGISLMSIIGGDPDNAVLDFIGVLNDDDQLPDQSTKRNSP